MTKRKTPSSSVAIGTASIFLASAALVSFMSDDAGRLGQAWSLRGSLVPSAKAQPAAVQRDGKPTSSPLQG